MDIISGMNFELLQFVGISLLCEYAHSIRSFHLYKKASHKSCTILGSFHL